MKRVWAETLLVSIGLAAMGCARPAAQGPVDVMDQVHAELAHTIDPVGEATLNTATIVRTPRAIDTELETAPTLRTWGAEQEEGDPDLRENPYTRERYETSQR